MTAKRSVLLRSLPVLLTLLVVFFGGLAATDHADSGAIRVAAAPAEVGADYGAARVAGAPQEVAADSSAAVRHSGTAPQDVAVGHSGTAPQDAAVTRTSAVALVAQAAGRPVADAERHLRAQLAAAPAASRAPPASA